eukprot:13821595-Alexandrium_andersonii.AAC.1
MGRLRMAEASRERSDPSSEALRSSPGAASKWALGDGQRWAHMATQIAAKRCATTRTLHGPRWEEAP